LYLAENQISDEGAEHLANALQHNQVTFFLTHYNVFFVCII